MEHYVIIGAIIIILIGLQVFIFVKNLRQMYNFRCIFGEPNTMVEYEPDEDDDGHVIGVKSDFSNLYFERIQNSIGKYMEANAGGTIDFQLIKDAVDRNCDSIEEDINAQIPLPLYIGLAGTMAGVIIGIGYMWLTGELDTLLDLTPPVQEVHNAVNAVATANGSDGIKTLLSGVALAMVASITGLACTTIATWIFKGFKLEVEIGKNSFFTWMQATLLPVVSSDAVDALRKLGHTLGNFNRDFSRNSEAFGKTMDRILGVNSTQNELLNNVQTMNTQIEGMSKRNLAVANRLSGVMTLLDDFSTYVQSINGYTDELRHFTTIFNKESDRLHILEAMKDFFEEQSKQLKGREDALKKGMAKLDNALLEGSGQLKNRFDASSGELKKMMLQQKDQFQNLLKSQTSMFVEAQKELTSSIRNEMAAIPKTVSALNGMPDQLKTLLDGYKKENEKLIKHLSTAVNDMNSTLKVLAVSSSKGTVAKIDDEGHVKVQPTSSGFPRWMAWVIVLLVLVMASASVFNSYLGYKSYKETAEHSNQTGYSQVYEDDSTATSTTATPTVSSDTAKTAVKTRAVKPSEAVHPDKF